MSTDLRRRRSLRSVLAVGAASVALLGAAAGSATAAPSPGQKIADALRTSPVYVDPSLASAVGPNDQRALVQQIRQSQLPIRVVLVPLVEGDDWGGKPEQLSDVVHDRMGGGPAILITPGDYPDNIEAHAWPTHSHQAENATASVFFDDSMKGAGLTKRISRAIDIIKAGDGDEVYQSLTAHLDTSGGSKPKEPARRASSPVVRSVALVAGPVLVLGAAWLLLRRRSRLRDFGTPFAMPRSVFAAAHRADEDGLRERAGAEVVRLGEEARAATGDPAAIERALDAYAAAGTVLDRARGVPDLAGVFALVAEGRAALSPLRPRCRCASSTRCTAPPPAASPGVRWAAGSNCGSPPATPASVRSAPAAHRRSSRTVWTAVPSRTSRSRPSRASGPPPATARCWPATRSPGGCNGAISPARWPERGVASDPPCPQSDVVRHRRRCDADRRGGRRPPHRRRSARPPAAHARTDFDRALPGEAGRAAMPLNSARIGRRWRRNPPAALQELRYLDRGRSHHARTEGIGRVHSAFRQG
ncbi:hypothetical protein O1L55_36065 [Streptomyces albulus]|nr:hypothetical protein [Streptomyces noursei]